MNADEKVDWKIDKSWWKRMKKWIEKWIKWMEMDEKMDWKVDEKSMPVDDCRGWNWGKWMKKYPPKKFYYLWWWMTKDGDRWIKWMHSGPFWNSLRVFWRFCRFSWKFLLVSKYPYNLMSSWRDFQIVSMQKEIVGFLCKDFHKFSPNPSCAIQIGRLCNTLIHLTFRCCFHLIFGRF